MHFLATQNWRPLAINCPLSKDGRSQIPSVSVGAEPTLTWSLFLGGAWCKRKVWIEKGMNWSCSVRGNWLAGVVKSELMLFCGLTSQLPSGCTVCLTLPRRSVKRGAPASSQSAPQTCPPATALCQCPIMYFSSLLNLFWVKYHAWLKIKGHHLSAESECESYFCWILLLARTQAVSRREG